jgi:hypothetical protein
MPTSALILSLAIIAGVLFSDLGRKAVTHRRLMRPLIIVGVAGATYLSALATSGTGLAIEIAGAAVGAVLGLGVGALMRVRRDERDGGVLTQAGFGYAAVWVTVIGARLAFIYGSTHWFAHSLGSWMLANQVTEAALTDALVLMALAMTGARTLSLIVRSRAASTGTAGGHTGLPSIG